MIKRRVESTSILPTAFKAKGAAMASIVFLILLNVTWTFSNMYMALSHIESSSSTASVVAEERIGRLRTAKRETFNQQQRPPVFGDDIMIRSSSSSPNLLRQQHKASIWTTRELLMVRDEDRRKDLVRAIRAGLKPDEIDRLLRLCGKFVYSSITSGAIVMKPDGSTFVATGDIDDMWTRDSSVQISLLYNRQTRNSATANLATNFRAVLEGTLRRNAFYIVQDPYANAYELDYKHPVKGWKQLKDRVIGRGGWVATRNYELDSGAYFLNQLWDYYVSDASAATRLFRTDPFVVDAVRVLVDVWTVERKHDESSDYRYFELPNEGLGHPTGYTGMTWTGFRPSDEPCTHHYLVPANIHAAAALERVVTLNAAIWKDPVLGAKTNDLLESISDGINTHGIVTTDDGASVYAYEVDGLGNALVDYDDANVPSLLSIPLLGWSGYDRAVYETTRKRILSKEHNRYYYEGTAARGIGSSHTPVGNIWPMALAIQGLTSEDPNEILEKLRELSGVSKCKDAMHESIHKDDGCVRRTRDWFEWANALFVVFVESALGDGDRCDAIGQDLVRAQMNGQDNNNNNNGGRGNFYSNKYRNNASDLHHYQGIQSFIQHERHQ